MRTPWQIQTKPNAASPVDPGTPGAKFPSTQASHHTPDTQTHWPFRGTALSSAEVAPLGLPSLGHSGCWLPWQQPAQLFKSSAELFPHPRCSWDQRLRSEAITSDTRPFCNLQHPLPPDPSSSIQRHGTHLPVTKPVWTGMALHPLGTNSGRTPHLQGLELWPLSDICGC